MSDPVHPPQSQTEAAPPPPYPASDCKNTDGSYPPQGQPGYPPQGQPGYPPQGQPGYPPQGQPGYPPQGQPGYPPQGQPGYPPQGQPAYQPQGQPGGTVIVSQPTVTTVIQQMFREFPVQCQCPNCHNQVTSQVTYITGSLAWLLCAIMFFFGLWLCCFLPFCIDSCQDAIHTCPVCKYQLGTYSRL